MKIRRNTVLKRSIAGFLCVMFLVTSFTACAQHSDESDGNKAQSDPVPVIDDELTSSATDAKTTADVFADLGEKDCGGFTYNVAIYGQTHGLWANREIIAEETKGEPINDAVFDRNALIAEKYNAVINGLAMNDPLTAFRNAIQADTGDYHACIPNGQDAAAMASSGMLYDLNQLTYVNFDNIWWNPSARETLAIGPSLFMMYGDMNISAKDTIWCTMFNKEMAAEYELANMYELVLNGTWTIDRFIEFTKNVTDDLDGDGDIDKFDRWGHMAPFERTAYSLIFASDISMIGRDENHYPVYTEPSEKLYDVFEKILDLYYNDNGSLNVTALPGTWTEAEGYFMENRILFYTECMQNIERFREMEVDFGILPMPKYDENQEDYISMVCNFAHPIVLPKNCADLDTVDFLIEALYAASHNTVLPAYYEKCLKTKFARDEDSSAMIDIIFDGMYFDPIYINGWGGMMDTIGWLSLQTQNVLASQMAMMQKKVQRAIDRTVEGALNP